MPPKRNIPSGGLIVTGELQRLSEKPGLLSTDNGGQRLRDLYQRGSARFDPKRLSPFGFQCYLGMFDEVKKSIEDGTAPDITAYETPYKWGYAMLTVSGSQRVSFKNNEGVPQETQHIQTLKYLLSKGAPTNLPDIAGYTALHHACMSSSVPAMARVLLEAGADVNCVDKYGDPPLSGACMSQQVAAVEVLMEFGASLDITNADDFSLGPTNFLQFGPEVAAAINKWLRKRKGEIAPLESDSACENCGKTPERGEKKFSACAGCKMVRYCSKECQKSHWPTHKPACKTTNAGNSLVFKPTYDTPGMTFMGMSTSELSRQMLGLSTNAAHGAPNDVQTKLTWEAPKKPFVDSSGKGLVIKVQIPLTMGRTPIRGDCLVYNRKKDFQCMLRRDDNPGTYDEIVGLIKTKGIGGAKAYFRAELPSPDKLIIRTAELLAEQAF